MNHDEHDDLWRLLGEARPTRVSSAFSQDVLRAIRMAEPVREPGFIEWLRIGWNWLALAGATAAVVLLALGMRPAAGPHAIATQESVEIDRIVSDVDFTLIANLDVLLAVDDNDLWLDPSLR